MLFRSMAIDLSESEIGEKQRKFERTIMVMNELLKGYRAKPRFPPGVGPANECGEIRQSLGTPIAITIRWYNYGLMGPVSSQVVNCAVSLTYLCRCILSNWECWMLRRIFMIKFARL